MKATAVVAQTRLLEQINASWMTQVIAAACELDLPDRLRASARNVEK